MLRCLGLRCSGGSPQSGRRAPTLGPLITRFCYRGRERQGPRRATGLLPCTLGPTTPGTFGPKVSGSKCNTRVSIATVSCIRETPGTLSSLRRPSQVQPVRPVNPWLACQTIPILLPQSQLPPPPHLFNLASSSPPTTMSTTTRAAVAAPGTATPLNAAPLISPPRPREARQERTT